jgi:hypothetical protein
LDVNGGPTKDDITWLDGANNESAVSWIDLGEDSSVTRISNTLEY